MSESANISPKLILEIGPGANPFPTTGTRKIQEGERYVGLERDSERFANTLKMAASNIADLPADQKSRMSLIQGDGKKIPMAKQSVDEVVLSNVLGLGITEESLEIAKESLRVLKPNGRIIVVETISPSNAPEAQVKKLFKRYGLNPAHDYSDKGDDLIDQYNTLWREEETGEKPYAVIFERKPRNPLLGLLNRFLSR